MLVRIVKSTARYAAHTFPTTVPSFLVILTMLYALHYGVSLATSTLCKSHGESEIEEAAQRVPQRRSCFRRLRRFTLVVHTVPVRCAPAYKTRGSTLCSQSVSMAKLSSAK
jgi:hypothetical protein